MLYPGHPMARNAIPSPAVPQKQEMPAIRVLRFFTKFKRPIGAPQRNSDGSLVMQIEEHWVEWVKLGETSGATCVEAVKRLSGNPEMGRDPRVEWLVIGPAYEAWRNNEDAPVLGTPIYSWSGASRELAEELKKHHIITLEDLAAFPDHKLNTIPIPGLRELRHRAKVTIEAREINDVAHEIASRDEVIRDQEARLQAVDAQMAVMQAQIDAMARNAGIAASSLTANMPHPDDEFVQPGPGDVPAGTSFAGGFQRRDPVDHIDEALGAVTGEYVEAGDGDDTDE
jgi:hypothetical protein